MMKPTTLATLALTTLMCLTAHAAHIRVSFAVVVSSGQSEVSIVEMVFDTSIPPEPGPDNTLLFYPVSSSLTTSGELFNGSPLCSESMMIESAYLQYFSIGNTISLIAGDGADRGSLAITNMPAAFNPAMDSLPDDPADWALNPATSELQGSASHPLGIASWNPGLGFNGGAITYCILDVPPPSNACSPADLNEDGLLNFGDVSLFLQIFGMGCP